ncbi:hypothetical protein IVB40_01535 [Bradyrhizobium sp. 40]|uniref:hypothetical protein n=1 Tax=Bradyrhizobium sp. 40 TaxID=2782674 RepID=UPI001FFF0BB1|nr:hypothetical protein [Bradyrhizobium sp. 40]UPJ42786.1 hypothetical protein IVB40_01535 [Bradyrhizobium sp. 40]
MALSVFEGSPIWKALFRSLEKYFGSSVSVVFVFTWADDGEHLFVEKATTTDDRIANTLSMDLLALLVRFD